MYVKTLRLVGLITFTSIFGNITVLVKPILSPHPGSGYSGGSETGLITGESES